MALAVLVGVGLSQILLALATWNLGDWNIYRAAADRILEGAPLYSGGDALHAYRYAPWLAYAVVPFSAPAWSALMLVAGALALVPLARQWRQLEAVCLVLIFGPILFYMASSGNVQALMLAAVVWTLPTRWAWAGIGLAASLKVTPLLFALVLVGERRWWQAAGAGLLAGLLWSPLLWMEVSPATFDAGAARMLPLPVWAGGAVAAAAVTGWFAYRRARWTALGAAVAALVALPRFFLYDVTLLVIPSGQPSSRTA